MAAEGDALTSGRLHREPSRELTREPDRNDVEDAELGGMSMKEQLWPWADYRSISLLSNSKSSLSFLTGSA